MPLNFAEQLKQINICALGVLRTSSAFINSGLMNTDSRVVVISSQ